MYRNILKINHEDNNPNTIIYFPCADRRPAVLQYDPEKQYDAVDKTDLYWTYNKVLEQPFKHLVINGGNDTHIFYEPSNKSSVRLLQEWINEHGGKINVHIKNDTLYLNFNTVPANPYEKFWLANAAPVRLFSPELLSVTGNNINFEIP